MSDTINFSSFSSYESLDIYPSNTIIEKDTNVHMLVSTLNDENIKNIKCRDNSNNIYTMKKYNSDMVRWGNHNVVDGFGNALITYSDNGRCPIISSAKSKFGNNSLYFDNINNSGTFLQINSEIFQNDTFTVSFWVNFESFLYENQTTNILSLDNKIILKVGYLSGSTYRTLVYLRNDTNSATAYEYTQFMDLENNKWINFTLCRNGDYYYIFANGSLVYSKNFTGISDISTLRLFAEGSGMTYGKFQPSGYLDELMICDKCLYTSNFTVKNSIYTENEFTGNYMVLHCEQDINVNNMSYSNSIINNVTYNGDVFMYDNDKISNNSKCMCIDKTKTSGSICINLSEELDTFSVGFWYRKNIEDSGNYSCIFSISDESNYNVYGFYDKHASWSTENCVVVTYANNGYAGNITDVPKFNIDEWYYITITKNNSGFMELYINGRLIHGTSRLNLCSSFKRIRIGAFSSYNNDLNSSSSYGDIYVSSEDIYNASSFAVFQYPYKAFTTLYNITFENLRNDTHLEVYPLLKDVNPFYVKSNGIWRVPTVYHKKNGNWELTEDVSSLINDKTIFNFKGSLNIGTFEIESEADFIAGFSIINIYNKAASGNSYRYLIDGYEPDKNEDLSSWEVLEIDGYDDISRCTSATLSYQEVSNDDYIVIAEVDSLNRAVSWGEVFIVMTPK